MGVPMIKMNKNYKEWSNPLTAFNSLKILFHSDHLRMINSWLKDGGYLPPPITCDTDGSNACNQQCIYCNSQEFRGASDYASMPKGHLQKLADFYAKWGIRSTCIGGGGESLVNPEIRAFIPRVRNNGVEVGLITNGILLDEDYASIVNENCRFLGISCDAATPETYKRMRGTDSLATVQENLRRVNTIRVGRGTDLDTNIKFLIHPYNYREIHEAARIAKDLGCRGIHIRPVAIDDIPGVGDTLEKPFSMEQYLPEINEQIGRAFEDFDDESFSVFAIRHKFGDNLEKVIEFNKCRATPINLTFSADGWAYICFNVRGKKHLRLARHYPNPENILKVWGTDAHKKIIDSINPEECPRCTYTRYHQVIEQAIECDCMFHLFP
jgi:MoaA/NifB/PqqE/SkfB family radical SAM enzyme